VRTSERRLAQKREQDASRFVKQRIVTTHTTVMVDRRIVLIETAGQADR